MILHLTKKLADKLKLTPEPMTAEDDFFSWRANYVQEDGVRFVVFMNDASRFSVVINEAKSDKLKKLSELFFQTLRETLLALCVNPEVIERYISELREITYAKNADRKRTAQLNSNTQQAWWGLRDLSDDVEVSVETNRIALYNTTDPDEAIKPIVEMFVNLGRYGLPVRSCRAVDLNVRLDLDGKDAVRCLRVPASISFNSIHTLLQKAFGWKNCHLHSFGLFKEWSDNPYARPDVELVVESDQYDAYETNPNAKSVAGVKLSDHLSEYSKILYLYDFGDDWHHYIEVENIIDGCEDELPVLLSGEGDAPPEDVGGSGGFAEFLEVIADQKHEDYEHMTEWAKSQRWKPFDFEDIARSVKSRW